MKLTISLLTDSLALPRKLPEPVAPREAWPALLRHLDVVDEVVHVGVGGATVHQLLSQAGYATACAPDVVVVQCGIVDCAPRALKRWERDALGRLPGGKRVAKLVEKNARALRGLRDIAFTPPGAFATSVRQLVEKTRPAALRWLAIAPASDAYERDVPGIRARVGRYNDILRTELGERFIDLSSMPADGLCSDHHHLTARGHAYVVDSLRAGLERQAQEHRP